MSLSSNGEKPKQEELYEIWKSLAPRRKYAYIEIGNQIGDINKHSIPFDEKISSVVNLIYNKLELEYVLLWTLNDDWLVLIAGRGDDLNLISKKRDINYGIAGNVAINKKHKIAWDLTSDVEMPFFNNAPFPKTHSVIALPIKSTDQVVGVLELGSVIHCDFREDEADAFLFVAWKIEKLLSTNFLKADQ
jgi:putative methionine-R-sulfoxide reductase with GAF domain